MWSFKTNIHDAITWPLFQLQETEKKPESRKG